MSNRVTIDEHRITLVNGKPFFPITARHIPARRPEQLQMQKLWTATLDDYHFLRDIGFNAVRLVPFGGQAFAREDAPDIPSDFGGLMFYAYVYNRADFSKDAEKRKKELSELVKAVRERNDLLGYEQLNEPAYTWMDQRTAQGSPEGMAAGSKVIRELDPNHPIRVGHMCSNLVATLQKFNACCDIVSCNPYIVQLPTMRRYVGSRPDGYLTDHADRTISVVGRYTDKMMRVAQGRQVWMQMQGSSNENWYNGDHTPETRDHGVYEQHQLYPSYWQMRYMAFTAIIHGAMGLEWMLVRHPVDAPSFVGVRKIIGELRDLHDVLAAPSLKHDFGIEYTELGFSDWDGVETLVKPGPNGKPHILAANTQMDPMIATFTKLPAGIGSELKVVGESREVSVSGGRFTDRFQPYEVHVYAA
jgi:hypothetical protein